MVESTLSINPHAAQFAAYRLPLGKYRRLRLYRKSVRIFACGRDGSLRERDMHLRCAIYLLRKCDIDKRCLSAIYSQREICFGCKRDEKYATYKSSRRAVRGISLAFRQISQVQPISQIREDLYRFSLSASSDKLNFQRGSRRQKVYF